MFGQRCRSILQGLGPGKVQLPNSFSSIRHQAAEGQRVSAAASRVAGRQDEKRDNDQVLTGVGVVVFWPVLFALVGDGPTAVELGRLKGEMEAIEKISVRKNCGIEFRRS